MGAVFAGFLLFPSLGLVQKYLGLKAVCVYCALGTWLLIDLARRAQAVRSLVLATDRRWLLWAMAATYVALTVAFAVLYPLSNSALLSTQGVAGGGSDRDESLNLGVAELLAGRYPYYRTTQLDNHVTQMPGSLLLAVPFYLLGNGAWQNFFWLVVFLLLLRSLFGDGRLALTFLWLLLLASPAVLHDFVTGGDLTANSVSILAPLVLLWKWAPDASTATWKKVTAALFAGVAFSSRASYLLLLPLLFAALAHRAGVRRALGYLGLLGLSFLTVTLPFYGYDPDGFAPLRLHNKFAFFDYALPGSGFLFPALSLGFALLLAGLPGNRRLSIWLIHCGLVQVLPVLCGTALATAYARWPNFRWYSSYGLVGLVFGALGAGLHLFGGELPTQRLDGPGQPEPIPTP
jgi:hypothetical protein